MSTCECYFLEWRYPIERNKRVVFNDDINQSGERNHDYYIDNVKIDKSVTGIIHQHFPTFNADETADGICANEKWHADPKYKYYQMPKCDILAMWEKTGKEASGLGSIMHMDIEMFYNYTCFLTELYRYLHLEVHDRKQFKKNATLQWERFILDYIKEAKTRGVTVKDLHKWLPDPHPEFATVLEFKQKTHTIEHYPDAILRWSTNDSPEFKQFIEFYNHTRNELFPYRTELIMFDEDYKLAGSIDMLFKDVDGNILIYDWKRSKEFKYKNYYRNDSSRGLGRMNQYHNCNIVHYSIQLNLYRCILETKYGETVKGMSLIRLHPNITHYDKYDADWMDEAVQIILEERKKSLDGMSSIQNTIPMTDGQNLLIDDDDGQESQDGQAGQAGQGGQGGDVNHGVEKHDTDSDSNQIQNTRTQKSTNSHTVLSTRVKCGQKKTSQNKNHKNINNDKNNRKTKKMKQSNASTQAQN